MDRRMDMDDRENRNNGYDRGDICSQDNSPDNKPEQESIRETDCEKEVSRLRSMTEDIQVPPSLEPEAVEKMLDARQRKQRRSYRWKYAGAAAAACLCLAVGITAAVRYGINGSSADSTGAMDSAAGRSNESSQAASGGETIARAENYDEIYAYIQAVEKERQKEERAFSGSEESESASDTAGTTANTGTASDIAADSGDYSDTNVREEGVGEADIVKTDGKNLYIVNGQSVEIVGIETDEMQEKSRIDVGEESYITELYVQEDRLVILYTKSESNDGENTYDENFREYTYADTYDVSDPSAPGKLGSITQSGSYHTMRVRDGYVYVISDFYADTASPRDSVGAYVPEVQGKTLEASDIYMPQRKMGSQYTVISSFSLENPEEKTDSKAVFGTGGMCYVSTENIYITEAYYDADGSDVTQTSIRKITYADGTFQGAAQTKVNGILNDSFSIDEYNGYLRLVTTVSAVNSSDGGWFSDFFEETEVQETEDSNSLYILDGELNITGEIHDLAPDESVYSARFMGDIGYFVTFRQVDPLFSADLSDPAAPEVIGELKIPGFSEYLHPYGEGKLLGIGMAVDEKGVTTEGVKVSIFDVSDPSDVTEEQTYIMEDMFGTDVGYDYKAVFVDVEKNLFGFLAYGDTSEYVIFTYDESSGFREVFSRTMNFYGNVRGLYAGDRFYLVSGNTVESYDFEGFQKVDDIVL